MLLHELTVWSDRLLAKTLTRMASILLDNLKDAVTEIVCDAAAAED